MFLVYELSSTLPCKLCPCHQWHYSQSTLLLTRKKYAVTWSSKNTQTVEHLQEMLSIIHFYVIRQLKHKQVEKHDRNENHVKETEGIYSVSSNKMLTKGTQNDIFM